jgi:hypothetical protein
VWPADLLERIRTVVSRPSREMREPEFTFELTKEAAAKNFLVLRKYCFSLEAALSAQKGTQLEYGSEFRTVEELAPVFELHPLWDDIKGTLTSGAVFPLRDLDEETRLADFAAALGHVGERPRGGDRSGRKRQSEHREGGNRNPLNQIGGGDGDVSGRSACVHHHDVRSMVE